MRVDGACLKTGPDSEAVVTLPNQVRLRMEQSTNVRVRSMGYGIVELDLNGGKAFASMPTTSEEKIVVYSPGAKIQASSGDFLVDSSSSQSRLDVLDGDAKLTNSGSVARAAQAVDPSGLVALDGPDVRSRSQESDEFNKKHKKKKGAGFVQTPPTTPPVTPAVEPPPVTPAVEPPPVVPPPVTPPPTTLAPAGVAGSATPLYIAGIAALGIGIGFAVTSGGSTPAVTTTPASP